MRTKVKGLTVFVIMVALCAFIASASAQPTPFVISGWVNYSNGAPVNNPTVAIENLDTSEVFTVRTNESSNYYKVVTSSDNVSTGDKFHFVASDGNVKEFNHTIADDEINISGGFVQCVAISGIANHVVISEIYPNPKVSGDKCEFIELYNPTDNEVNITNWVLEDNDSRLCTLSGTIPIYGFFLIGTSDYNTNKDNGSWPDADLTPPGFPALANTGGDEVRLKDSSGKVIDKIGYGSDAEDYEGSPTSIPSEGESLQRKINATITGDGYGPAWDTNNNSADFFIQTNPNPQNSSYTEKYGPVPPIPELSTFILFSTGLIALAGYVLLKRK